MLHSCGPADRHSTANTGGGSKVNGKHSTKSDHGFMHTPPRCSKPSCIGSRADDG